MTSAAGDSPLYDSIGSGYSAMRREDPRLRSKLHAALGDARTVVNVGAGAGSYEPTDRHVIAIEPSQIMAGQRSQSAAPAIRATAEHLPLWDGAVDAGMSVLSLHHWSDRRQGVRELRRVCRGPIAIVTIDARVSGRMWLMADYLPETARLEHEIFPPPERVADWLGGDVAVETWPVPRDSPDWTLASFWAHPERALDPAARDATSGFARMPPSVVERVVRDLGRDLADGSWDARHAQLRTLDAYDAGVRLVIAR